MSTREINLIAEKRKLSPEEQKIRAQIRRFLPIFLGIYVVILIAVLGFSYYVNSRIGSLNKVIASEQETIKLLYANESNYLLLKQKASSIKSILTSRYPFLGVYSYFRNLETKGGKIGTISMSEVGEVTLSVTLQGSTVLDDYINTLLAEAQQNFRRIELGGISIKPGGNITVSLLVDTLPNPVL